MASIRVSWAISDVRDISDGAFPVNIVRIAVLPDGERQEDLDRGRALRLDTLAAAVNRACRGVRGMAKEEWVEIRTPLGRAKQPPCGNRTCTERAAYVDSAGCGWCFDHTPCDVEPVEGHPFDPWWLAATLAAEAGGGQAARWKDLEHGQYPEWRPKKRAAMLPG